MTLRHFDRSLGCLVSTALDELATQLSFVGGLSARERDVIGRLSGENSEQRWQQFLELIPSMICIRS